MLKKVLIFFILTTSAQYAWSKGRGLVFDGAIGFPSIEIKNPDGIVSGYEGLSLMGHLTMSVVEEGKFGMFLGAGLRYHDLENSYSTDSATEVANHMGPNVGIQLQYGGLHLGYDYAMMKARHYYIGSIGKKTEFDYTSSNIDLGASVSLGTMRVGLSYTIGMASISKDQTGLSADSDYSENTIWLTLRYASDLDFGGISKEVMK